MPPGDDEVQFSSPTSGAVQAIPPEHWDEAIKQGYKPTTHTVMYSPDGQRGMVHNSQLAEHMKQGYQVQPQTQFEKDRPGKGITTEGMGGAALDATKGLLGNMWEGAKKSFSVGDEYANPGDYVAKQNAANAERQAQDESRKKAGYGTGYRMAAGMPVPVNASSMEKHAERGEGGAILGEAAAGMGATVAPSIGSKIMPSADTIGLAARTEKGALKPMVRRTAGALGAVAGHATGVPVAGPLVGYALGGGLADMLTPERPFDIPIKGESVGASLPDSDTFYANRGKDLTARGRQQEMLDRKTARQAKETAAANGDSVGAKIIPEPREPMPGDRPGAMWSVGREDVLPEAAQRGTPGAGDVLRNTGQPIIYTPREGVGYPGPRPLAEESAATPAQPRIESIGDPIGQGPMPEPQPLNPLEAEEMSESLGRKIAPDKVHEVRRRLDAERNIEEGLKGNRRDTAGETREEHRAKLEKKGRR